MAQSRVYKMVTFIDFKAIFVKARVDSLLCDIDVTILFDFSFFFEAY